MLPLMANPRVYRVSTIREQGGKYFVGPKIQGEPGETVEQLCDKVTASSLQIGAFEWLAENGRWFIL
jgi:hypothetical protein